MHVIFEHLHAETSFFRLASRVATSWARVGGQAESRQEAQGAQPTQAAVMLAAWVQQIQSFSWHLRSMGLDCLLLMNQVGKTKTGPLPGPVVKTCEDISRPPWLALAAPPAHLRWWAVPPRLPRGKAVKLQAVTFLTERFWLNGTRCCRSG